MALQPPHGVILDHGDRNKIRDGIITVAVLMGHWDYTVGQTMVIGYHSNGGGHKATLTNVEKMTLGQVPSQAAVAAGFGTLVALKAKMKTPPCINANVTDSSQVTCLTFQVFQSV
tara:strand:- start:37908 stop:38252 length:345 start_codon:yes stop_codon:yes gene_type:complete